MCVYIYIYIYTYNTFFWALGQPRELLRWGARGPGFQDASKGGCSGNRVWWFTLYYLLVYYMILPPSTAPPSDCTPL